MSLKKAFILTKLFFSYDSRDIDTFHIPVIVDWLEQQPGIDKVYYWHRDTDLGQTFDDYMVTNITMADAILLFCSEHSKISPAVNQEIGMARQARKRVVPVFLDLSAVPDGLRQVRGIQLNVLNIEQTLKEILSRLLKMQPIAEGTTPVPNTKPTSHSPPKPAASPVVKPPSKPAGKPGTRTALTGQARIIVPLNLSPAGEAIPPGQTVIYSCIARFMQKPGSIISAAMSFTTHMILTDKGIVWRHKQKGPMYTPWETVVAITNAGITLQDLSVLGLVHDTATGEEKAAFSARSKTFAFEVVPYIIGCLESAIANPEAAHFSARDVKNAAKRLEMFKKFCEKLEKRV
ncbi:MAG TPA: TIR domain-containing protein [Candidatus Lokiarchaeia archaeon]|nr:TIR domain-containing protein [Candidatus Lokiarchaeia archaeon]